MPMTKHRVKCPDVGEGASGFHDMAYVEWGDPSNARVLICVHGLTRNGRDFDVLAAALQDDYRVICPDVAGRGRSDWLTDPAHYGPVQYDADMNALIAQLDAVSVDWIGTSMGGIIGMVMAATPENVIRRMVLNDVGPCIPKAALERIGTYVGHPPVFDDVAELEAYLRQVHAPFGDLTDAQWAHMAAHGGRPVEGGWTLGYDPDIALPFMGDGALQDVEMWALWDAIECPTLALRGEASDLLLADTAAEMATRGPKADLVTIPGCGHAPALMADEQINVIRDWLAPD
ncbi:MAG: alpha/beta hydrolase [Rhodospirillaceae bacterium]|nr:alpha/beta hydrolase [Rhodospirillaceae bacterium]MBT5664687.1 alpha/beta hydrolase [Rhodospirillaceae bacterium]